MRETVRIAAEHFSDAVQASGAQIVLTDEQLKILERVRELRSHSNFSAFLGEIVSALAKEYLDRNDPLRRKVKPRSVVKKSRDTPNGKTSDGGAAHSMKVPLDEISVGSPQGDTTAVFGQLSRSKSEPGSVSRSLPRSLPETGSESGLAPDPRSRGARRASIAPSTRNFVRRRAGDACEYHGPGGQRCGSRFQTQMEHVIPVALGGMNDALNLRLLCRTHNLLMVEKTLGLNKMRQFRKPL